MREKVDDYSLFVYVEDDMLVTDTQVNLFMHESSRLIKAGKTKMDVGFYRVEVDVTSMTLDLKVFEETNTNQNLVPVYLGPRLGWLRSQQRQQLSGVLDVAPAKPQGDTS